MKKEQKEYLVTWQIEIYAGSAEEAAREALEIQRDQESIANVFTVSDGETEETIDFYQTAADEFWADRKGEIDD